MERVFDVAWQGSRPVRRSASLPSAAAPGWAWPSSRASSRPTGVRSRSPTRTRAAGSWSRCRPDGSDRREDGAGVGSWPARSFRRPRCRATRTAVGDRPRTVAVVATSRPTTSRRGDHLPAPAAEPGQPRPDPRHVLDLADRLGRGRHGGEVGGVRRRRPAATGAAAVVEGQQTGDAEQVAGELRGGPLEAADLVRGGQPRLGGEVLGETAASPPVSVCSQTTRRPAWAEYSSRQASWSPALARWIRSSSRAMRHPARHDPDCAGLGPVDGFAGLAGLVPPGVVRGLAGRCPWASRRVVRGLPDGLSVGMPVAAWVGFGFLVGCVGCPLGSPLGTPDGWPVGRPVGFTPSWGPTAARRRLARLPVALGGGRHRLGPLVGPVEAGDFWWWCGDSCRGPRGPSGPRVRAPRRRTRLRW